MTVLLIKLFGGNWCVACTPQTILGQFSADKFDAALQFACGYCESSGAELKLDHDAVKEISQRYLKPCVVAD